MSARRSLPGFPALVLAGLAALALLVAACDPEAEPEAVAPEGPAPADTPDDADTPDEAEPAEPPETPTEYQEAPALAEQVEAGELPPVDERLPDEPFVEQPWDRVGTYGGLWRSTVLGPGNFGWTGRNAGYETLLRWDEELTTGEPNIAAGYDVNDDATEFTIHLRPGLKWSDGEEFTAHDIDFWYNDVQLHPELGGGPPVWMTTPEGEAGSVEAVDDHTVVFTFPTPNGMLPAWLAASGARQVISHPRHYLEQFHADYNADVDALVAEHGAPDWAELLMAQGGPDYPSTMFDPDLPTLMPWRMVNRMGDGANVRFERNPYYWRVDPEGNQLPYLDEVIFDLVEDEEITLLKALNGELHMQVHHGMRELSNIPLVAEHQEQGDYRMITEIPPFTQVTVLNLNLTHKDPVLREIFQNRDFRVGLSHGINRQEILDVVFQGLGEPYQVAERPESERFFDEEMAYQYTEYDPDLANEYLDQAGYAERDGQGYRLRPDGEPITFAIDVDTGAPERVDVVEFVAQQWSELGLDVRTNVTERSFFQVRIEDNDHDASVWDGGGGFGVGYQLNPRHYFPYSVGGGSSAFATEWARWYQSRGEQGEEPPEAAQRQMELFDVFRTTGDLDERDAAFDELLEISKEQFWTIGVGLKEGGYGVARNNTHNIPDAFFGGGVYNSPGAPSRPHQFFQDPVE